MRNVQLERRLFLALKSSVVQQREPLRISGIVLSRARVFLPVEKGF